MSSNKPRVYTDKIRTLEDEKRRIIEFRETTIPIPVADISDAPYRCYKINLEWTPIVIGWLSHLAEVYAWTLAENEDYEPIQQILKMLKGGDCMTFELRQSPFDGCLIEQSIDGGVNWSTAFDLSQCLSIVDNSSTVITSQTYNEYFNNVFQNVYNNYVANYVDSPDDVYPSLEYGQGIDAELDAAYCNAVYTLVSVACDMAAAAIRELDEIQHEINVGIAVASVVLAVIAIAAAVPTAGGSLTALAPIAAVWGVGMNIGAAVGNDMVNEWQNKTIDEFRDVAAQFEVTCYLIGELSGENNTYAAMQTALENHTLTGNAGTIADTLEKLMQNVATYSAFLEKWNNNLEYAEAGITLFCPCNQAWEWSYSMFECDYGLPLGWSLDIQAGACGDGPGTFNGLYDYGGVQPANLIFKITPPSGLSITLVSFQAARNVQGGSGTMTVTQGTFTYQPALLPDWKTYSFAPNETGEIIWTMQEIDSGFNGVGVRQIRIEWG